MGQNREKPGIEITLDHGYFDPEDFQSLARQLEPHFRVGGGTFIELSDVETLHAVVQVVLPGVLSGLLANALYDALKSLKPRGTEPGTEVEFEVTEEASVEGGRRMRRLKGRTTDPAVLKRLLEQGSDANPWDED